MAEQPDTTHPAQEAASGPGAISARQVNANPNAPDAAPHMPRQRATTPVVGTPGASDQTDIAPPAEGLAGQVTNDQQPNIDAAADQKRPPPDMVETPDPRGDARIPPLPR